MPAVCAIDEVIFSMSYACHPGRHTLVSVQAARKRKGQSNSSATHHGRHVPDPSPSAAGEN